MTIIQNEIYTQPLDKPAYERIKNYVDSLNLLHVLEQDNYTITPIEERIYFLYPNNYGLYPHEILALYLIPEYQISDISFPKYWWYEYGVKDVHSLFMSLIDRGFMRLKDKPTIKEILQSHKMDELRSLARIYDIKITRKKEELIQAISENMSSTEVERMITVQAQPKTYIISEKGKEAIFDDKYVLYTHRYKYYDFNIYSLNQLMQGDTQNYQRYILGIFKEEEKQYFINKKYNEYSSVKFQISEFLSKNGQFLEALKYLAEVIYIDLSSLYDSDIYPGSLSKYFMFDNTYYIDSNIPSGIIGRLCEYQEKLNLTNEQLACILKECFASLQLPFHVFSNEECVKITLLSISGQNKEIELLYQRAKQRLKEQYPEINFD